MINILDSLQNNISNDITKIINDLDSEKLILSKTGKELRGLAKINKMIKVFKEHYIFSHL